MDVFDLTLQKIQEIFLWKDIAYNYLSIEAKGIILNLNLSKALGRKLFQYQQGILLSDITWYKGVKK